MLSIDFVNLKMSSQTIILADCETIILLIDCGHMIFVLMWKAIREWKKKYKLTENIISDKRFYNILKWIYFNTINELVDKYGVKSYCQLKLVRDTRREDVWRKEISKDYKDGRKSKMAFKNKGKNKEKDNSVYIDIKQIFIYTYNVIFPKLVERFGVKIIKIPKAEADDVIAVISQEVPDHIKIIIISQDHDFLQLLNRKNLDIYSLYDEHLNDKIADTTAEQFLLKKIISGDKTDNIPGCINNKKKIEYYMSNPDQFDKLLDESPELLERFNRNRILIDFAYIPEDIRNDVIEKFNAACA